MIRVPRPSLMGGLLDFPDDLLHCQHLSAIMAIEGQR